MSTKYRVWVKHGEDMAHGAAYRNVADFEYIDSNDQHDLLIAETDMPLTLERMLNTDRSVVKYADYTPGGAND